MSNFYIFEGHEPTRQGLTSEGDDARIPGIPHWPRGQVRAVTDDMAEFLDATKCFTRVDGYPENGVVADDARGVFDPAYLPAPPATTTEADAASSSDESDSAAAPAAPQTTRRGRRTTSNN